MSYIYPSFDFSLPVELMKSTTVSTNASNSDVLPSLTNILNQQQVLLEQLAHEKPQIESLFEDLGASTVSDIHTHRVNFVLLTYLHLIHCNLIITQLFIARIWLLHG